LLLHGALSPTACWPIGSSLMCYLAATPSRPLRVSIANKKGESVKFLCTVIALERPLQRLVTLALPAPGSGMMQN